MSDLTDNEPCRLSGESGTTHEAGSDNDAHASTTIHVRASTDEDVLTRYLKTVKAIQREISLFNAMEGTRMYSLSPVLLMDNVDADVSDMFPSSVGELHVKLMVTDRQLFITNVSMGDAHSCAVTSIIHQAGSWSRNVFSVKSNTKFESEDANYGSAPDLVIEVPSANLPDGAGQQRLVIVEVEVSHRDILGMRRDFAWYYNEPTMHSVIGVKFLPRDKYVPSQRVMAVQWTRQPDSTVAVEQVWDFGILGTSPETRRSWGEASSVVSALPTGPLMSLPPVPPDRWADRRFTPVSVALLADLPAQRSPPLVNLPAAHTRLELVTAAARLIKRHLELGPNMTFLYGGDSPQVTINGDFLVSFLNNIPEGSPPLGALLGDLTLDFGFMMYAAQRGVRDCPKVIYSVKG